MRVLITGNGRAGSWQIRGEQLGAAIGAEVMPFAEMSEIRGADLVIAVKKTPTELLRKIAAAGVPWVWDTVDAWPQPSGNYWDEGIAIGWLRGTIALLKPNAIVYPTTRMQQDAQFIGPSLVVPHHAWHKYSAGPVRDRVRKVGYEGDPAYLGKWREIVTEECERRGWQFQIGDLVGCDIGVCLRDVPGYPSPAWKANTKLANCQALGIPALCSPEFSYWEFGSGTEAFVKDADDVRQAFNTFAPFEVREAVSEAMQRHAPRLDAVAKDYKAWLGSLKF